MPGKKGVVLQRGDRSREEMDRIFHLIVRDDLDSDAIAERWGLMLPTARCWRQDARAGRARTHAKRSKNDLEVQADQTSEG